MNAQLAKVLKGAVMFWTVTTTVFTLLPLVRILGRPEGYSWSVLGLSGVGFDGPSWMFVPLVGFAIVLLFVAERGPRHVFYPMLLLWHLLVLGVVVVALMLGGGEASWQGQGLYWTIPMWVVVIPASVFATLAVMWVVLDRRLQIVRPAPWSRTNSLRLAISLALLIVALGLFRAGTTYNWVTALAIVTTVTHWVILSWSFAGSAAGGAALHAARSA